jgi:Excalibur calcium-binding domain
MRNCAEATFYLTECGLTRLDDDGDGIPCEGFCRKNPAVRQRRVGAQSAESVLSATYKCGKKRSCAEMDSCEDATFHLQTCKLKGVDHDGDARPAMACVDFAWFFFAKRR